jgi:hypothetical protein
MGTVRQRCLDFLSHLVLACLPFDLQGSLDDSVEASGGIRIRGKDTPGGIYG